MKISWVVIEDVVWHKRRELCSFIIVLCICYRSKSYLQTLLYH